MECIVCDGNDEVAEDSGWCKTCEKFAPILLGESFKGRPTLASRKELNPLLSPHREKGAVARWRALLEESDQADVDWAFGDLAEKPELEPAFKSDKEPFHKGYEELRTRLCSRTPPSKEEFNFLLQQGLPLPNHGILSKVGTKWGMNGHRLRFDVPYNGIIRAFTGTAPEKEQAEDCDWSKLLPSLGIVVTNGRHNRNEFYRNLRYDDRRDLVADRRAHVLRRMHGAGFDGYGPGNQFRRWLVRLFPEYEDDEQVNNFDEWFRWPQDRRDIGVGFPWQRLDQENYPWIQRWQIRMIGAENHRRDKGTTTLDVRGGKVHLRVIKGGRWVWTPLPPWPRLWALLTSWALSHPDSQEYRRLIALQWMWHHKDAGLLPSEPEKRALSLLRSICESSDKCQIPDSDDLRIIVQGTSSMYYAITPGPGAHNAIFRVHGSKDCEHLIDGGGEPLCLREDSGGSQLPAGDVYASVVLSLMDDLRTSENLAPLRGFIIKNDGDRNLEPGAPGWLRQQRREFRHRPRFGRWLRHFPRIYEVLVHMPMHSTMRIPRQTPSELSIDETEFTALLRSVEEVELVEGLARVTGWRSDGELDEQGRSIWRRVDAPIENVRRNLVELLGPFERQHGRRGDPPWWHFYRNPIAPRNLPGLLPENLNFPIDRARDLI